jgi:hypothetical protein
VAEDVTAARIEMVVTAAVRSMRLVCCLCCCCCSIRGSKDGGETSIFVGEGAATSLWAGTGLDMVAVAMGICS